MANKDFQVPIKGYSTKIQPDKQPYLTTGYISNMYPIGTILQWLRLIQRPGTDKVYSQQIGGDTVPIVILLSVTTVD
ncbi:hypothetical protein LCGC14_2066140 [marine sediment metagenome]|uniref:Uncharacterized protein n=1 Tax=marine sediment metagenome TaxID=412755 RepID=A0A0F9HGU0_9ZZZZ